MPSAVDLKSKLASALPKTQDDAPQHTLHLGKRVEKVSVSLYGADFDRIDAIKQFLANQGVRNLSDSEALRIANRGVTIDDRLLDIYRTMQQEDGRRRRR